MLFRSLFDTMCGIHVDGENHFTIAPQPGGQFTHATASYQSIYGLVESGWKKTETGFVFTVAVPVNCTASIHLPNGRKVTQRSGTQVYTI